MTSFYYLLLKTCHLDNCEKIVPFVNAMTNANWVITYKVLDKMESSIAYNARFNNIKNVKEFYVFMNLDNWKKKW